MRIQLRYLLPYDPEIATAMTLRYEKLAEADVTERVAELRDKGCALFAVHPEGLERVGVWEDVEIELGAWP